MSTIEKALKASEQKKARQDSKAERSAFNDKSPDALRAGRDFIADDGALSADGAKSTDGLNERLADQESDDLNRSYATAPFSDDAAGGDNVAVPKTDLPFVRIPFEELQRKGFLTPNTPRSRIAEEFRGIKRPILRNISKSGAKADDYLNLVMVTSALQGDGKTFSSINLALSIAMEQDKTVLFVDADVVRATAGKTLGIEKNTPGLIDLLDEQSNVDPSDVILTTNMETLRILPAGNASDKSTELLASETMHQFMVELSHRYPDRVIVFDSPPLLLTTEAAVLASFMGQILFVASADVTPQHAVKEALEHIGEDKIAGVMLNRASRRRSKLLGIGSYGYGYGYGNGYGYGYGREDGVGEQRKADVVREKTD